MRIAHLGLLSLAFLGSPSFAEAAMDMKPSHRVVVSTRGLDLSTDAGVRAARARVRRAAEQVCGDYPRVGLLPPPGIARCRTTATREAEPRIAALASRASNDRVAMADTGRHDR
ncbi:UrcA family protein [Sphingomonas cannabina]|uniref:UrcA family protein n=1 Tax=Sphingomonas cannabina TaxID=2899123 RepID=UPI001F1FB50E|nr:UrcA family protein [Sphingomonas cannabina]UIJ44621.1 UrcA family protein [Sphingomonas cannabina]